MKIFNAMVFNSVQSKPILSHLTMQISKCNFIGLSCLFHYVRQKLLDYSTVGIGYKNTLGV